MPTFLRCAECAAEISVGSPLGLCTRCIFGLGLTLDASEELSAENKNLDRAPQEATQPRMNCIRRFGDYELLEEIARGAMGVVYRARQVSLDRIVAIKMILHGQFASREAALRFRVEAEAAAKLHHPNIVVIHETGEHECQPYFSMDCIEGGNLAALVHDKPLPPKRAAALMKTICEAVHYAHEQGVLHRDLKPSNILLDQAGQPRITDFGLAKRMQRDSFLTMTGQVLGSPNFMPPEQADTKLGKAGRYSDVYALGGVLFYLLTSRPPFVAETAVETLQQALSSEAISPKLLNPHVSLDLATICLKCLEKDPAQRYATANELAEDLGRFLSREPIRARPTGRLEKAWRWCKRKPMVAGLTAATALLLLAVTIGSPIAFLLIKAEQQTTRENLYAADMSAVQQAIEYGDLGHAREFLVAHMPGRGQPDSRGFEWRHLWARSQGDEVATLQTNGPSVSFLSFSPDGRWLAGGDKVWEISSRLPRLVLNRQPRFLLPTNHIALLFAPDGELLIKNSRQELKRWNPLTGREILILSGETVQAMAFSGTGRWLAIGTFRNLQLWDTSTWTAVTNSSAVGFNTELLKTLAFSGDEQWLIMSTGGSFSRISTVEYWSVPGLQPLPVPEPHERDIISVAFSQDGREFYTGSVNGTIRMWDSDTKREIKSMRAVRYHRAWICQVIPLPGGQQFVTASADRTIRISQPGQTTALTTLRGHTEEIWSLAVSPDGKIIATGDSEGTIKLWPSEAGVVKGAVESLPGSARGQRMQALGLSKDGRVLAMLSNEGLKFWNLEAKPIEEIPSLRWAYATGDLPVDPASNDGYAAISSDFEHFAAARKEMPVEIWDIKDSKKTLLEPSGPVPFPLFSPDSKFLVASTGSNDVTIWDAASKEKLYRIQTSQPLQSTSVPLTFSSDGGTLAVSLKGKVMIWDFRQRRQRITFPVPERLIMALSTDGGLLATGSENNLVRIFDASTGLPLGRPLEGHISGVEALAFSPDGQTLLTAAEDSRLWHLATRRTIFIHPHSSPVIAAFFSHDAGILVLGEIGQRIEILRAPSLAEIDAPGSGIQVRGR